MKKVNICYIIYTNILFIISNFYKLLIIELLLNKKKSNNFNIKKFIFIVPSKVSDYYNYFNP